MNTLQVCISDLVQMIVSIRRFLVERQAAATAAGTECIGVAHNAVPHGLHLTLPNGALPVDFDSLGHQQLRCAF
jgi:hypothetical protein